MHKNPFPPSGGSPLSSPRLKPGASRGHSVNMAQRVIIGGFWHESDTFNPQLAASDSFEWMAGNAIREWATPGGKDNELAGALVEFDGAGVEVDPSLAVAAPVSGPVPAPVFDRFLGALEQRLAMTSPQTASGIYFALHGSTSVEGRDDAQAELVAVLRRHLGPHIPLVISVDLHASPSPSLIAGVDAIVGYRTAPHRDIADTGRRAARLLLQIMAAGALPWKIHIRLPLLLPGEFGQTDLEPMRSLVARVAQFTEHPTVLEASFLQGYPWADNPNAMVSLCAALAPGTAPEPARTALIDIARAIFAERAAFYRSTPALTIADALVHADQRSPENLLYLCDSGDNPTAGAVEDRVDLLQQILAHRRTNFLFAPIVAPSAVDHCIGHVGQRVSLTLGGQLVDSGPKISASGSVLAVYPNDALGGDVVIWAVGGNRIVLTRRRVAMHDPAWLTELGLNPADPGTVYVLKSGYLFPAYQDLLASIPRARAYLVATPGASSLDLMSFPYRRLPHPIYPLDSESGTRWAMTVTDARGRSRGNTETLPL